VNLRQFFSELQRRKVYRAAVGYAAGAWLLVQVATQVFPFFEISPATVRLIVLLALAGAPIALVWAWFFELTPEGIKRTEDLRRELPVPHSLGRKIDFMVIAILAVALALLLFDWWRGGARKQPDPVVTQKSVAVLPFENMSEEPENAYFADGIQDDILTSLTKIRNLKVISRTSVMNYRARTARNLREIGKTLGVAHVLEGSVRRSGNRVKVGVQLIAVRDNRHIWAESYDKTISDALNLQGELATEIAAALQTTLSPEEKAMMERKPTDNSEAYLLYLRARKFEIDPDTNFQDYKAAVQLYDQAIKLDPSFALAHARLAATMARIYHFYEPTDFWAQRAKAEAQEALRLQPQLGEAHFARGLYFYWLETDYEHAVEELRLAQELVPNNTDIGSILASIARRQGRWDEAVATFERTATIDPQNTNVLRNLVYIYGGLRRYPEAIATGERLTALAPNSIGVRIQVAYMPYFWKGDTTALETVLNAVPAGTDPDGVVTAARWDVAMIKRDFTGAEAVLVASPATELSYLLGGPVRKPYFFGCAALARGDEAKAQAAFETVRPDFEAAVQEAPLDATRHANLGLLYAFLGRKEQAIAEGRRAVELKPESRDAVDGPLMSNYLVLIFTRLGEYELALPLLERLLHTPHSNDSAQYSVSPHDLRLRWEWDPLRSDPRFQNLLEPSR